MPLVRKYACPSCENRDHLEIVDRAFSIRPIVCTDEGVHIAPRADDADLLLQEVGIICRACSWSHNFRDCTATLDAILRGKNRCSHD